MDDLDCFKNSVNNIKYIVWHIGPAPLGNMPEKISLVFSASPGSVLSQTIGGQQKKIRVWKIYTFFLNYAIIK